MIECVGHYHEQPGQESPMAQAVKMIRNGGRIIGYKFDKNWTGAVGIDNLNNHNYFLFHPFPQRTLVGNLRYTL